MYAIQDDTNGRGVFATQDIQVGTLIMSDPRLLGVRTESAESRTISEAAKEGLFEDAVRMSDESFEKVWLHCERAFGTEKAHELAKAKLRDRTPKSRELLLQTVIQRGIHSLRQGRGQAVGVTSYELFDDFHAVRYSCNPNAQLSSTGKLDLRASKPIDAGEEIVWALENPFRRREERRKLPGAKYCRCEICRPERKQEPNEHIYVGMGGKFATIHKFRMRYFGEDEIVDFSKAHDDEALLNKAKAINALPRPEISSVEAAVRWLEEQKELHGLRHSCFAEIYEVVYLINFARVVEHGNGPLESGAFTDIEDSAGNAGQPSTADFRSDDERRTQYYVADEDMDIRDPLVTAGIEDGSTGHRDADHDVDEESGFMDDLNASGEGDHKNEAESLGLHSESCGSNPSDPIEEALTYGYAAKVQEMIVKVRCLGFEHYEARMAIEHTWNITHWYKRRWRAALQVTAGQLGFHLREKADGSCEARSVQQISAAFDALAQATQDMGLGEQQEAAD